MSWFEFIIVFLLVFFAGYWIGWEACDAEGEVKQRDSG